MAQNTHRFVVPNGEFKGQSTITHVSFKGECVGVGDHSFENCSELSKINDDNVIETIGSCAFTHTVLTSATFNSVKTIGNKAFEGCKELTSISINNDCTSIGDGAFGDCEKLTDVTIPTNEKFKTINDETFYKCASLSKIIIPNNVTTIGRGAFKECKKLTDVTIGSGVETIGNDAFNFCTTLSTVSIPDSVKTIGGGAFKECYSIKSVKIGKNVTSIGSGAFSECSSFTDVELNCETVGSWFSTNGTIENVGIGDNVKTIGDGAFKECSNLTVASISNNVTSIGKNAFEKCSNFTFASIPDSVKTIGGGAFNNCTNLSGIYIGVNVSSIGADAFSGCSNIEGVYTNDLTKWCNINFENCDANPVTNSKTLYCNGNKIINLKIPDGVTSIGSYNFYNCKDIISIRIPSTMTSNIGGHAFFGSGEVNTKDGVPNFNNYNGCRGHVIINYSENLPDLKCGNKNYGCIALYAADIINAVYDIGLYIFDAKKNGNLTHYVGTYFGSENSDSDSDYKNTEIVFPTNNDQQNYKVLSTLFNRRPNVNGMGLDRYTDDITSVTILENSAEEFENNVFDGCTNLSELIINYSDTPLKLGYKYHNTEIDENEKPKIGQGLFYDCQNIKEITLNRDLNYDYRKECGYSPFSGIKSNFNVTIGNDVTKIGNLLFYYSDINNITIGENVTEIGSNAFEMCQKLNGKVIIPNSVQTIGACAFFNCDKLTSVTLPKNDNFKTIKERLFYHCDILEDVTIPDSVTTIENYAFENCKNIKNVYIPNSVTKIGENAFYNCSGIKYITIGQGIEENSFGENSNSFRSVIKDSNGNIIKDIIKKHEVINFSQIKLPDEKGKINEEDEEEVYISKDYGYVVYGASYLLNAIDGSQIDVFIFGKKESDSPNFSLLRYMRDNVADLDDIPLYYKKDNEDKKYIIAEGVFSGHEEIESITIPEGVIEIENDVFNGCSNLKEMRIDDCKEKLSLGHINYNQDDSDHNEPIELGLLYDTNIETFYLGRNIDYDIDDGKDNDNIYKSFSPLYNKKTLKTVTIGEHVTEINENLFCGCENLDNLEIGNGVVSIGEYSFRECKSLTQVRIPESSESVTSIGRGVFYGCSGLQEVSIPNTVKKISDHTFWGCSGLTSVNIPNSVTSIEHYAFENCSSLKSVTIPESVTSIGLRAFFNCDAIEKVTITDLSKWCKINFHSEPSTPMGAYNNVEPMLYLDYTLVEYLKIPNDITEIKKYTFLGCHSLRTVEIHSLVKSIGDFAFKYCKNITDLTIDGNDDFVINTDSFGMCENLTNISLNNVKSIGEDAFECCQNLKNVIILSNHDGGCIINKKSFRECENLTNISLNNVNTIDEDAFKGCKNIENIYITDLYNWCNINFINDIKENNDYFENYEDKPYSTPMWGGKNKEQKTCLYLKNTEVKDLVIPEDIIDIKNYTLVKELEIPEGITEIKDYTFFGCHSIEKVTIPNKVTSISAEAFKFCYNLKTVINYTTLKITKGGTDHGYVGYYANRLINAPNGKLFDDGFFFGTEEGCDYLCGYIGNDTKIVLPEKSLLGGGKYAIGKDVFLDYNDIVSVKIPNKVFGIGENAFGGCTRLTNITIPGYINEDGLPIDDWYIEQNAFYNCSFLTSVTIGNGCTSIGENAFSECYNLKRLVLGKNVKTYYNILESGFKLLIHFCPVNVSDDHIIINYSNKTVEEKDNWMYSCDYFTKKDSGYDKIVPIAKLCCYMGDDSELIIPNLQELIIPDGFKNYTYNIGEYSFAYMNNITSITITEDIDVIELYAFKDCIGLKRIVIENNDDILIDGSVSEGCKNYILIDFCDNENKGQFGGFVEYICEPYGYIVDDFIFNSDDKNIKLYIGNDSELELPELKDGYIFDENFHYIDGIDDDNSNDGDYKDYKCTSIKISNSVEKICDNAFVNFYNLTKIEIGNGVKSIGPYDDPKLNPDSPDYDPDYDSNGIFIECFKLNEILIDESNGRYSSRDESKENCNAIIDKNTKTLIYGCNTTTIPNDGTVTAIGLCAFRNAHDLKSIEIPDSVKSIANKAFYGCYFTEDNFKILNSKLNKVKVENGYWGATIVDKETPDGLLIKGNAVKSCRSWATSVTIPDYVTSIEDYAFQYCSCLTSVTILEENSLESIGESAFANITSLREVTIKRGSSKEIKIGNYAFSGCKGINKITIPDNAKYSPTFSADNKKPFEGCIFAEENLYNFNNSLTKVYDLGATILNNKKITNIDYSVETTDGLIIIKESNSTSAKVYFCRPWATEVTIPETVTFTKKDIYGNEVLETRNVTSIGNNAFKDCSALTSVTIPNKVTSIGKKAFYWCNNLTSVTLTNNKDKETGNYESIGISGENSKTIGIGAFTHVSNNFKIYVPNELITDYINNAEWKYYFEHIEGYDIKEEPEQ